MSDPRPTVGPFTEAIYARLPEVYRDADAAQDEGSSNYPLLRYLSLLADQLTAVVQLLGRLTYSPLDDRDNTDPPWDRYGSGMFGDDTYGDLDTADLVDPFNADAGWLPWLAQLVGVDLTNLDTTEQRAAIASPSDAWAHGTPPAIAKRVVPNLTGGQYVDVQPHHQGDPFTIAVITKADETAASSTWAQVQAIAPTWADLEALGDWSNVEAATIMREANKERPAGYKLEHVYLAPPPA